MTFLYPHKPDSKPAPSSENDKPVETARQGMKPTAKPKDWRK